jgi:hypothetical protein
MANKRTILLYGRTNSGKTAQIGELAEYVKKTEKKNTRLYTADKGGTDTIRPYIDLGIIEPVEMGTTDPWIFLNKAVRGYVRDSSGKWVPGKNDNIGMFAFESLRAIAEALMTNMAQKAAQNINIGGGANISFTVTGDGESLKISGSNMAMFGIAQNRITEEVWESQKLSAPFILWTSSVSKDEDTTAAGKILGPDVIGKALTAEVPRWFNLVFRIDVLPAQAGKPERHVLYLGNHVDVGAGNAAGLGNTRLPLDAPAPAQNLIEPASIVKALQMIEGGHSVAIEKIKQRLAQAN